MAALDWVHLVYLLGVLVLLWPALRMIRGSGNMLVYAAVWLGVLTLIVAASVHWQR
jgi:hypothetical protein